MRMQVGNSGIKSEDEIAERNPRWGLNRMPKEWNLREQLSIEHTAVGAPRMTIVSGV